MNCASAVFQPRCGGNILIGHEPHPVGRKAVGEGERRRRSGFHREGLVDLESALEVEVHQHLDNAVLIGAQGQLLAIVAVHQVGVRVFEGFDDRIFPGATLADGFAELPEIIDAAGPQDLLPDPCSSGSQNLLLREAVAHIL